MIIDRTKDVQHTCFKHIIKKRHKSQQLSLRIPHWIWPIHQRLFTWANLSSINWYNHTGIATFVNTIILDSFNSELWGPHLTLGITQSPQLPGFMRVLNCLSPLCQMVKWHERTAWVNVSDTTPQQGNKTGKVCFHKTGKNVFCHIAVVH